ncbi:sulp-7 [Pristionchus pacificus]|nr:sulp-7 [Pristionchus pacificus]
MGGAGTIKTLESSSLVGTTRRRSMAGKIIKKSAAAVLSFLPILKWLPRYSIKKNLLNDVVGGFTVGIMHVPQGIAYASLAGVRPVVGLYTSLLAPLFYMIFGTSRHISIGVFAVVSLMCGACNVRVTDEFFAESSSNYTDEELGEAKLDYALHVLSGLGFVVGIIQISMGVLRLDFLISFLSDQVVTGFMLGASFHVFVAQLDKLLGVTLPRRGGIGKLFMTLSDVIQSLMALEINLYTTVLSISAIIFLFSIKTFVDPLVKRVTPLPVPYDLFLLIIGTVISTIFDFNTTLSMKIIGKIPTGLPSITPPDLTVIPHILGDAAAISVVILVVSISMGKVFSKKHKYEINVRQEFFALGLVESLGSFFPVWPSSTALARTLVYEAAGTKTQLATVFSSFLLLAVLFFVGPFLELLPVCLLSCVIVVALKGMFMKLVDIPALWRVSRIDAIIFVLTLFSTVSLNIIEGLAIGAAVSIIHVLLASKRGGFTEQEQRETNRENRTIKVLRYDGSLYFMNTEEFSSKLRSYADAVRKERIRSQDESDDVKEDSSEILVDLSALRFIDYSGSAVLLTMISNLEKEHVRLGYVGTSDSILLTLRALPDWSRRESHFYSTLDDVSEQSI